MSTTGHGVVLKFLMTGLLSGIVSPITVLKMCPPLTTKNWNVYAPLLAVGKTFYLSLMENFSHLVFYEEYISGLI